MRTLPEKYLSEIAIPKDVYDIDLVVLDRYQSFSAELLRLALLGLAGYGFLVGNIVFKVQAKDGALPYMNAFISSWPLLVVGVLTLALAAMMALGHRYFATDSLTQQVRRLRLRKRLDDLKEQEAERERLEQIIAHESQSLMSDLNRCRWLLLGASIFLLIGATGVALSFALTLAT